MRRLAAALSALLAAGACAPAGREDPVSAAAEAAWESFESDPSALTFDAFIRANRDAARRHGRPDDARGLTFRVRALEAEAAEASRRGDQGLALGVIAHVDDITRRGVLDAYEEALPGCRERFLAARRTAAGVVE